MSPNPHPFATVDDTNLSAQGRRLVAARAELAAAMEAAKRTAVLEVGAGVSEYEAARHNAITRPTLRQSLGKQG